MRSVVTPIAVVVEVKFLEEAGGAEGQIVEPGEQFVIADRVVGETVPEERQPESINPKVTDRRAAPERFKIRV